MILLIIEWTLFGSNIYCSFEVSGGLFRSRIPIPGINNTGNACISGVIDSCEACITHTNNTGKVWGHFWVIAGQYQQYQRD
jgi:hypothetical protein